MTNIGAIRIVECGEGVSAAYGAKLIADLGAEVVKIEPPEGDLTRRRGPFPGNRPDPEKSGLFIYLNTNKQSVTADLRGAEGRELLDRLLGEADILIHNVAPTERAARGSMPASFAPSIPDSWSPRSRCSATTDRAPTGVGTRSPP